RAQRFIEASTACGSVTPFVEGGIGPGNAQICADDSHTIRQRVENAFRLNEILGPRQHCGIECIRVDSVKTLAVEKGQPSSRTVHSNELPVRLAALQEIPGGVPGTFHHQNTRSLSHSPFCSSLALFHLAPRANSVNYRRSLVPQQDTDRL